MGLVIVKALLIIHIFIPCALAINTWLDNEK